MNPEVNLNIATLTTDVEAIVPTETSIDGNGIRKADDGNYYVKVKGATTDADKNGYYKVTVNATNGHVTVDTTGPVKLILHLVRRQELVLQRLLLALKTLQ